jgi:glycosyltransferase involved in cell wall biosynthesis
VSDRVGIAPDIAECGAGLVVPVESRAVAGALIGLLSQPALREAMGQRGRGMVCARFSGPAVARAMLGAYERVRRRS